MNLAAHKKLLTTILTIACLTSAYPAGAAEPVGVADCDQWIPNMDQCIVSRASEEAKAELRTSFDRAKAEFQTLKADPQMQDSLASACRTAKEIYQLTVQEFGCLL